MLKKRAPDTAYKPSGVSGVGRARARLAKILDGDVPLPEISETRSTLDELSALCGTRADYVIELVEAGIIRPQGEFEVGIELGQHGLNHSRFRFRAYDMKRPDMFVGSGTDNRGKQAGPASPQIGTASFKFGFQRQYDVERFHWRQLAPGARRCRT